MWIKVTKLDIERGVRGSAVSCPVARALKRKLNWPRTPFEVETGTINRYTPSEVENPYANPTKVVELPLRASAFILDFDAGEVVEPISFQVARP